jgi:hypothetical protein
MDKSLTTKHLCNQHYTDIYLKHFDDSSEVFSFFLSIFLFSQGALNYKFRMILETGLE